jgi:hypothetical protein
VRRAEKKARAPDNPNRLPIVPPPMGMPQPMGIPQPVPGSQAPWQQPGPMAGGAPMQGGGGGERTASCQGPVPRDANGAVDTSRATDEKGQLPNRNLWVGGFPPQALATQVKEMFLPFSSKVEVVWKVAYAFVNLASTEDAVAARHTLQGTDYGGRNLKINCTFNP